MILITCVVGSEILKTPFLSVSSMHSIKSIPDAEGTRPTLSDVTVCAGSLHFRARKYPSPANAPDGERPPSMNLSEPYTVSLLTVTSS